MSQFLVIRTGDTSTDQTVRISGVRPTPSVSKPDGAVDSPEFPAHQNPPYPFGIFRTLNRNLDRHRAKKRSFERSGQGLYIIIENFDATVAPGTPHTPNHVRFWQKADGSWDAEFFWGLDDLLFKYQWERRYLRQHALNAPVPVVLSATQTVNIKVPTRLSLADHTRPQLAHLDALTELSDADYETQAPLLERSDGSPFRPTKAQLRKVIDAERAAHKLAHERSVATAAEIDRLYAGATADIPDGAGPTSDAVTNRAGFEKVFRAFNTETYWNSAPRRAPEYEVLTVPDPAPPTPPTPAPVPEPPTGDTPQTPPREG